MNEIKLYEWIEALKENPEPDDGEIVLAWNLDLNEPAVMKVELDDDGWAIYKELVSVDILDNSRNGPITHWMRITSPNRASLNKLKEMYDI